MSITIHGKGQTPNPNTLDYLRLKFNAARDFYHIDGAKYAEITGVGMSTAYSRKRDITHMTLGELYAFTNAIGVTLPELFEKY